MGARQGDGSFVLSLMRQKNRSPVLYPMKENEMAKGKTTTVFFCNSCGYESSKWMGQCPGCRAWNTFVEETVSKGSISGSGKLQPAGRAGSGTPMKLSGIQLEEEDRIDTHIAELNRVLGGGLVRGSLVLVGGDPGIGKSTLLLQVCRQLSKDSIPLLYISGEESLKQIKMRAQRIGEFGDSLSLLCETDLSIIEDTITKSKPQVVVIDSIQTMFSAEVTSAPGSVSQVREATSVLLRLAKSLSVAIFIVGHVTKEGTVAGPRVLEHMVDTVLYFEGDRHASYRILRGVKNRFGSTNEIGVFEMRNEGLVEVENPSEYMLNGRPGGASGSVVVCAMEGTRPLLIELQALVCRTSFGIPRRQATGADLNRVNLLMAVLEKRVGLKLGECDAYVNVAGGMKLNEPAVDLAIILAIVSSYKNISIPQDVAAFGEVGLSGEVRSVSLAKERVREAYKLGFKTCILPKSVSGQISGLQEDVKLLYVDSVKEALDYL